MDKRGGWLGANTVFYRGRVGVVAAAFAASLFSAPAARSAEWWDLDAPPPNRPTFNDFGETGLLQMPTARLHPDGEIAVGASILYPYDRYFFNFTMLPWMEGTLRYSNIMDHYYGAFSFSGTQNYKDRSLDAKVRLLQEGPSTPDVTLVLRDFGGSGFWSSEYLMASRRYYNFDLSGGIAWGQSALRSNLYNPLRLLSHHFDTRGAGGSAGSVSTDFFSGPSVGLIGGVEWQTPIDSLKLKVEYDGNNYTEDFGNARDHGADPKLLGHSPVNMGLVWAPFRFLDMTLARERGRFMAGVVMHGNMDSERGVPIVDTPPPQVAKAAPAPPQPPPAPIPAPQEPANSLPLRQAGGSPEGGASKLTQAEAGKVLVQLDGRAPVPAPTALCEEALTAFDGASDLDAVIFSLVENQRETATITFHRGALFRSRQLTGDCYTMSDATWRPGKDASPEGVAKDAGLSLPPSEPAAPGATATASAELTASQVSAIGNAIFADLAKEKMQGIGFGIEDQRAVLRFRQGKYRIEATALGRAARIVANRLPPQIALIDLVLLRDNLPVLTASVVRSDIANMANGHGSPQEVAQHLEVSQPTAFDPTVKNRDAYPNWGWGLAPKMRENIGGPQNFFFFQIYALMQATLSPLPGWNLSGGLGRDLYNNFKDLTLPSDSTLPHVRSDIVKYLEGAPTWMDSLNTTYSTALGKGFYAGLTAGYFEWMYAGVGGEVLYKPVNARWAVGVDANRVRKRDFDGGFGLQDYMTTTGHVTLYYRWPYYDINTTVRVGRFLAKDTGANFEVSRQFGNGMIVGAFVTKTNVSAAQFGEGAFDKGLFVSIPLDLFVGEHTTARGNTLWRPLTRDGGQLLGRPMELYETVRDGDRDALMEGWKDFGK